MTMYILHCEYVPIIHNFFPLNSNNVYQQAQMHTMVVILHWQSFVNVNGWKFIIVWIIYASNNKEYNYSIIIKCITCVYIIILLPSTISLILLWYWWFTYFTTQYSVIYHTFSSLNSTLVLLAFFSSWLLLVSSLYLR